MTSNVVPLVPTNQTLQAVLNGVGYRLDVRWNAFAQLWVLDVYDVNQNPILSGVGLATGLDLLDQYAYLGIGGQLFVASLVGAPLTPPAFADLGVTNRLFYNSP